MSTISIIGSGGIAMANAKRTAKAGHTLEVIGRDTAKVLALADQLAAGATIGTCGAVPAGDSSLFFGHTGPELRRDTTSQLLS